MYNNNKSQCLTSISFDLYIMKKKKIKYVNFTYNLASNQLTTSSYHTDRCRQWRFKHTPRGSTKTARRTRRTRRCRWSVATWQRSNVLSSGVYHLGPISYRKHPCIYRNTYLWCFIITWHSHKELLYLKLKGTWKSCHHKCNVTRDIYPHAHCLSAVRLRVQFPHWPVVIQPHHPTSEWSSHIRQQIVPPPVTARTDTGKRKSGNRVEKQCRNLAILFILLINLLSKLNNWKPYITWDLSLYI